MRRVDRVPLKLGVFLASLSPVYINHHELHYIWPASTVIKGQTLEAISKLIKMTQPMLSLKSEKPQGEIPKATPHLLPCRVHHSGPIDPVHTFWEPKVGEGKASL